MEHHHGPRARNPLFDRNRPWVHITVEYATSTANFCPRSLSNSFLRALMTTEDSISREKNSARKLLRSESLAELGNLYCAYFTQKNRNMLIWPIDCLVNHNNFTLFLIKL